jgi:hypothetical protein
MGGAALHLDLFEQPGEEEVLQQPAKSAWEESFILPRPVKIVPGLLAPLPVWAGIRP